MARASSTSRADPVDSESARWRNCRATVACSVAVRARRACWLRSVPGVVATTGRDVWRVVLSSDA